MSMACFLSSRPHLRVMKGHACGLAILVLFGVLFSGLFSNAGLPSCEAAETTIPLELELSIFLKIISYNRAFSSSSSEPFKVGLIISKTFSDVEQKKLLERAVSVLDGKTLLGRPVQVSLLSQDASTEQL